MPLVQEVRAVIPMWFCPGKSHCSVQAISFCAPTSLFHGRWGSSSMSREWCRRAGIGCGNGA